MHPRCQCCCLPNSVPPRHTPGDCRNSIFGQELHRVVGMGGGFQLVLLMEEIPHQLIGIDRYICIPGGAGFLSSTVPQVLIFSYKDVGVRWTTHVGNRCVDAKLDVRSSQTWELKQNKWTTVKMPHENSTWRSHFYTAMIKNSDIRYPKLLEIQVSSRHISIESAMNGRVQYHNTMI